MRKSHFAAEAELPLGIVFLAYFLTPLVSVREPTRNANYTQGKNVCTSHLKQSFTAVKTKVKGSYEAKRRCYNPTLASRTASVYHLLGYWFLGRQCLKLQQIDREDSPNLK